MYENNYMLFFYKNRMNIILEKPNKNKISSAD